MSLLLLFGAGASAGTSGATTLTGTSGVPVVAGREYLATAEFRANATARSCSVSIDWYAGATYIGSHTGTYVTDSTSTWTQAKVIATAPATATFASVVVNIYGNAAAEIHYVDKIGFMEPDIWTLPE